LEQGLEVLNQIDGITLATFVQRVDKQPDCLILQNRRRRLDVQQLSQTLKRSDELRQPIENVIEELGR
jgi:hypothetical protein